MNYVCVLSMLPGTAPLFIHTFNLLTHGNSGYMPFLNPRPPHPPTPARSIVMAMQPLINTHVKTRINITQVTSPLCPTAPLPPPPPPATLVSDGDDEKQRSRKRKRKHLAAGRRRTTTTARRRGGGGAVVVLVQAEEGGWWRHGTGRQMKGGEGRFCVFLSLSGGLDGG